LWLKHGLNKSVDFVTRKEVSYRTAFIKALTSRLPDIDSDTKRKGVEKALAKQALKK